MTWSPETSQQSPQFVLVLKSWEPGRIQEQNQTSKQPFTILCMNKCEYASGYGTLIHGVMNDGLRIAGRRHTWGVPRPRILATMLILSGSVSVRLHPGQGFQI